MVSVWLPLPSDHIPALPFFFLFDRLRDVLQILEIVSQYIKL